MTNTKMIPGLVEQVCLGICPDLPKKVKQTKRVQYPQMSLIMGISTIQKCHSQTRMHHNIQRKKGTFKTARSKVPQTLQYTTEVDVHNSAQQLSQTQQNTIEGQVDNGVFTDITNDVTNLETDNTADITNDITNLETDLQVLNQTDLDLEQLSTDLQLDVLVNGGTNVGLKDSFYIVNSNEKGDRFLNTCSGTE